MRIKPKTKNDMGKALHIFILILFFFIALDVLDIVELFYYSDRRNVGLAAVVSFIFLILVALGVIKLKGDDLGD